MKLIRFITEMIFIVLLALSVHFKADIRLVIMTSVFFLASVIRNSVEGYGEFEIRWKDDKEGEQDG